jgi:hypothetical protein
MINRLLAKLFGTLIVEIDTDGTLSTYLRFRDKDYEVPYLINEKTAYEM